jgi:gluconolactonase
MRRIALIAIVLISFALIGAGAQDKAVPLPEGLVAPNTVADAAGTVCFLEGPAVDADGNVFFSDIAGNRIMKMNAKDVITVFRADSGRTNGNCFDAGGRLISCEGGEQGPGRRRLVRTDMKTGKIEQLTAQFEGKRYNSPNDVCVDTQRRIWFTDPYYGPDRSHLEMDVEGVYRIDPIAVPADVDFFKVTRVLTQKEVQRPNGIAITPDDKTLYVIDSHPKPGGNRKIWAFDVDKEGALSKQRSPPASPSSAAPARRSTIHPASTSSRQRGSCWAAFRCRRI